MTLINYCEEMEKTYRINFEIGEKLHVEVYEFLTKRLKKESRKVRLGEFVREAMREKLDREQKKKAS